MGLPNARTLSILLLICGTARAASDVGQARQAISAGTPTADFPAVAALVDDSRVPFCTGALFSSFEVVTAAHCFSPALPELAATYFGSATDEGSEGVIAVEHVWLHPDYDPLTRAHDLALLTLVEDPGIAPLPLLEEPLSSSQTGSSVRVVGFGHDGISAAPLVKRVGWARIESSNVDALRLQPSPATPCAGDSGGPILLDTPAGLRSIGVVSHGDPLCASHALATPIDRTRFPFAEARPAHCSSAPGTRRQLGPTCCALGLIALGLCWAHRRHS